MKLPGFTAEASIYRSTQDYAASGVPIRLSFSSVNPAAVFSRSIPLPFPLPIPFFDPCDLCISDCVRRGGNYFSCQNACSFLCF